MCLLCDKMMLRLSLCIIDICVGECHPRLEPGSPLRITKEEIPGPGPG